MSYSDSIDFDLPQSGSHLLSESYDLPDASSSSSRTGPGGDDLSLSDLALNDRPRQVRRRPFSLLARPQEDEDSVADESAIAEDDDGDGLDHTMTQEEFEKAKKLDAKAREEKLQHDLFILKKLNSALEVHKDALRETKSGTERVAMQIENTNALLDKYMNILSKSENVTRLILDERWQGAEADEDTIEREHQEALERARREEEERALAERREKERVEREARERQEREEREALERERAEKAKLVSARGSGVRGVRGTRASMRGARATSRTTPPGGRGARAGGTTVGGGGTGISGIARPTSSASTRGTSISRVPRKQ